MISGTFHCPRCCSNNTTLPWWLLSKLLILHHTRVKNWLLFQKSDSALYIKTSRPVTQLPQEDSFSLQLEGLKLVETTDFFTAVELYFEAVFMFDIRYPQKMAKFSTFVQNFWLGIRDGNATKQMRKLNAQLVQGKNLYK